MEIHIGNRVADVTLVSKEGNKYRDDGERQLFCLARWELI